MSLPPRRTSVRYERESELPSGLAGVEHGQWELARTLRGLELPPLLHREHEVAASTP